MDISHKTIVITGAASGIGRALLEQLQVFAGVKILAVDRDTRPIEAVPGKLWTHDADISQAARVDEILAIARKYLGSIDLFFANAGFAYYGYDREASWQRIEAIYATNVFSPIYTLQKLRELNADKSFRMVMTASAMGFLPVPGYALYAATKASLVSFAESLRFELDDPCTLTLVYPIATRTKFFQKGTPVPWPAQAPEEVARCILAGIHADKKDIFPSKIFLMTLFLHRLCPLVGRFYQKQQFASLQRWKG